MNIHKRAGITHYSTTTLIENLNKEQQKTPLEGSQGETTPNTNEIPSIKPWTSI